MKKKILEVVKAHASSSHTVIVSLHWGDEYIDRPALWQRDYAKSIVNAGATLLIGHHPHVVQGIEHAGRSLIAYSLGNFIFDMISEDVNWSVILSITIRDRKVVDWTCVPISCGRDFRPELASGARKRHLEEEILRRNKLACMKIENRKDYCEEYFTAAKKLERFHRRLLWKQTGRNFFSLKPIFWPQVLLRPTQRRLGWW
jgi:poly-gamma-glutamate synthesis protein (capsule biosynthesis protein)